MSFPNRTFHELLRLSCSSESNPLVRKNGILAARWIPDQKLDLVQRVHYMAFKSVIGQLISAFEHDDIADAVKGVFIYEDFATELFIRATEIDQRDGVDRAVVDELLEQARFLGKLLFSTNHETE